MGSAFQRKQDRIHWYSGLKNNNEIGEAKSGKEQMV